MSRRKRHPQHQQPTQRPDGQSQSADASASGAVQRFVRAGEPPTSAEAAALQQSAGNQAAAQLMGKDGAELPNQVKSELEGVFGERLDDVRVHTDTESASIASRENADAIAVGDDIAFAAGKFQPGTIDGDALIAHEVTHTIQQRDTTDLQPAAFRSDGAGEHAEEREADRAMGAILKRRLTGGAARLNVRQLRSSFAVRRARICSKEPSLEEVRDAVTRAEQITALAEAGTGNPEAARHFRTANTAFGQLGGHVDTAINVQERAQDAWDIIDSLDNLDRLQDDSGAWADQQAAAHEFGRLFAAAGRIMEATGIPGVASYGTFLAGASDFFSNMYEVINVDAITRNRAERQGLGQYMPR